MNTLFIKSIVADNFVNDVYVLVTHQTYDIGINLVYDIGIYVSIYQLASHFIVIPGFIVCRIFTKKGLCLS